jgi:hypothetical protein
MIRLKEGEELAQSIILYPAHPQLKPVLLDINQEYAKCNADLIITEWHRTARHGGDIHDTDPQRAADIRVWNIPEFKRQEIAHLINSRWIYDPQRSQLKVMVYGDKHHTDHAHIQVCSKTVCIKNQQEKEGQ